MNCSNCGAPLRLEDDKDYATCDYCGNVYCPAKDEEGVRVLDDNTGINCPVCAAPLAHAAMSGVRFSYCTRCHGMLISMDRFGDLTDNLRAELGTTSANPPPPSPRDLERALICPMCHKSMDTHRYGGPGNVIIDSCETCSVNWLDHGELLRIARTPDHRMPQDSGEAL